MSKKWLSASFTVQFPKELDPHITAGDFCGSELTLYGNWDELSPAEVKELFEGIEFKITGLSLYDDNHRGFGIGFFDMEDVKE